jgi:transcriptional regulator with XRE-family HTH domain
MNMNVIQTLTPAQSVSAREELNLSQAKVASNTGVSRPYLSQFEGGKRILEDGDQQKLLDYFLGHGWEQPEPVFEGDGSAELVPYVVHDGFVVPNSISNEDIESILEEYCENSAKIEGIRSMEVKRGAWSGNIDIHHANAQWLVALMLTARQFTIKQLLHGQVDMGGEFVERDKKSIATIGEYGDDMFYRIFVKGESLEFRV